MMKPTRSCPTENSPAELRLFMEPDGGLLSDELSVAGDGRCAGRANIPYQVARGVEFYNRKEIKDVLAYLRVIANPNDEVSLSRIVNVPTRLRR